MEILSSHRKSSPSKLRRPFAASSSKVTVTRRLRLAVKYVLGLGLLYLVAVYFWGAREAQRRWLGDPDAEENGLGLMDVGGQGAFPSSGLTALKHRLGVPGDSGPDAHAEYFTTEYFIDEHDERNRGILPLREPAEKSCFADEIPGVEPFPLPPRATLYAPVTRSASSDACADALNTNKVAIMMMSKGEIHHTHVWRQWFASAAGRLPVGLDSSCTSLSSIDSAETQAACSKFMDVKIPMSEILDDPLAHQILFNLYVHVPPGSEDELDDLFRPFVIPRRVKVAWGTSSMMYAMRELIWFAFQDPRNTRFVLLSESDVPIYGPLPFYHELMADTKSRVDTTTLLNRDTYRWHFRFMCADPPLLERDWRKSSQWFTMIREHAELVLRDVSMYRAFERFCHEFWDDVAYWWRVCYSDEHYIPTLLWVSGEGNRTYPVRGPSHVDWSTGGEHPIEYSAEDVSMELFRSKLRITQNCTRDLQSQMSFINEVEEMRFADVPRNWGQLAKLMDDKCKALATLEDERKSRHEEHVESQQQQKLNWWALYKLRKSDADDQVDARFACPLAARKFKKGTTDAILKLLEEDCRATGRLGIVDDRVCQQWPVWWKRQSKMSRVSKDE